MGGEVGANVQRIFSYGHRNSFGMAFDPVSGALWLTENARFGAGFAEKLLTTGGETNDLFRSLWPRSLQSC